MPRPISFFDWVIVWYKERINHILGWCFIHYKVLKPSHPQKNPCNNIWTSSEMSPSYGRFHADSHLGLEWSGLPNVLFSNVIYKRYVLLEGHKNKNKKSINDVELNQWLLIIPCLTPTKDWRRIIMTKYRFTSLMIKEKLVRNKKQITGRAPSYFD